MQISTYKITSVIKLCQLIRLGGGAHCEHGVQDQHLSFCRQGGQVCDLTEPKGECVCVSVCAYCVFVCVKKVL